MSTIESAADIIPPKQPRDDVAAATTGVTPDPRWRWFWIALLLTTIPLMIPYLGGLWGRTTYRFFPFAIAGSAYLAYSRSDRQFYPPRGGFSWGAILFGVLLVLAASVLQFTWFSAVAFVIFCTMMFSAMRGEDDESLLLVALPLFSIIRLIRIDDLLVLSLQRVTTWMSSVLLDVLAVPHAVANNVIRLADRELFVAEACSGIQSVFTLGFLALMVVAWKRRRVWMTPLYLGIACLLAIFANVVRVTVVAYAASVSEFDLAEGWPHELLGYISLAMAFGFLLSFDYLVSTMLHRVPEETDFNPIVKAWNYCSLRPAGEGGRFTQRDLRNLNAADAKSPIFRLAQQWVNHRVGQIGFLSVAVLLFGYATLQLIQSRKPANLIAGERALVFDPPSDLLNASTQNLTVVNHLTSRGFELPGLGANSDVWECQWQEGEVRFVLSQPHQGWHELCDCYERLEWTQLDRSIRSPDDFEKLEIETTSPDALKSSYVVARFKRGPAAYGYLIFSGIGSDGTLLEAPDSLSAMTHRIWNRIDTTGVWEQNEVLMLQMWLTVPEKLKPKELQSLEQEFIAVRASISDAVRVNAGRSLPESVAWFDDESPTDRIALKEAN
ncbi:MAG: exosortase U [Planctomycetota bacterium]